jgi:type I restriction enzyme S subunit
MSCSREVRLGEVAKVVSGFAFKSELFGVSGDLTVARIRDVVRGFSETYYTGPFEEKYLIKDGDLLVGMDGEFNAAPWKGGRALLNQRVCRVEARPTQLDAGYLRYFLPSRLRQIEDSTPFVTVKHLSATQILDIPISLPSLTEQHRIAVILDKADAVRRKRQQATQLTDDLLRSAFLDVFGDPVTNPRHWPLRTAGQALSGVEAGWSAKGDDRPRAHDEWAVLKISAVTSGRFDPTQHKVVDEPGPKKRPPIPRRGDLLFSRANTRELVGAVALVEREEERLFLPDKLWRLVPNRQVALPEYLRFVLGHRGYRTSLAAHATGTSGSMLNVSKAKLLRMRLPVPPVAHQEPFAAFVWKTYDAQEIINRSAIELNSFFESLVQRAFRGDL